MACRFCDENIGKLHRCNEWVKVQKSCGSKTLKCRNMYSCTFGYILTACTNYIKKDIVILVLLKEKGNI